jgi:hypothetical protein
VKRFTAPPPRAREDRAQEVEVLVAIFEKLFAATVFLGWLSTVILFAATA